MSVPGPTNGLPDVAGLRVGQHTLFGEGWLSGVTVILAEDGGMTAGVDVRGGGPGTRETDLLDPTATVPQVNAIVLSGGSAYGLASAGGVADELGARGIGFSVGPTPDQVVPIVPAAVVFDLGRGGQFGLRPGNEAGASAARAALVERQPLLQGCVGAGTGTVAGGLKGGLGSASTVLSDGAIVAALVVLNAMGSVIDERTGELFAARFLLDAEPRLNRPKPAELACLSGLARPPHASVNGYPKHDVGGRGNRRRVEQGPVSSVGECRSRWSGPCGEPGAHALRRRYNFRSEYPTAASSGRCDGVRADECGW
jgi:L-aminopeptidase/D-esterase-like protein